MRVIFGQYLGPKNAAHGGHSRMRQKFGPIKKTDRVPDVRKNPEELGKREKLLECGFFRLPSNDS